MFSMFLCGVLGGAYDSFLSNNMHGMSADNSGLDVFVYVFLCVCV